MEKIEIEQENNLLKSFLYCTEKSCNNCGYVNCENFQRQRKNCCERWISFKDYIAELEKQIEKMKCCGNCIHCYEGAYHNGYRCKDHARESVCDNWEMMTDEVRKEMLEDD